jgi:hypothetical protein
MQTENIHLTDQELLLAADGELPARRAAEARAHLSACWNCRSRMAETERTITDFTRAYRQSLDPRLPPIAGSRARFETQLAELAVKRDIPSWHTFFRFAPAALVAASICVALLFALLAGKLLFRPSALREAGRPVGSSEGGVVPDRNLTPGATRIVAVSDVCSMMHEEVVRQVSAPVRQKVFQEYGIVKAHAEDYEIDYLIAPGLGGVEDIHNLWPEPYSSSAWNAHVKDALEEHLHELVCAGRLDLSTAQRDIATDWIAAYKKYFHTDKPLSLSSKFARSSEFLSAQFVSQRRADIRYLRTGVAEILPPSLMISL